MTYLTLGAWKTQLRGFACGWLAIPGLVAGAAHAGGDTNLALGRHLAAECSGCHGGGSGSSIPPLAGRTAAELAALLKAYAAGRRIDGGAASSTMVSVAQSLDDAQIAAVAAFLATLPPGKPPR